MDELDAGERVRPGLSLSKMSSRPRSGCCTPIRFEVKQVAWWSVYEIGQRLCDRFDNLDPEDAEQVDTPRLHRR